MGRTDWTSGPRKTSQGNVEMNKFFTIMGYIFFLALAIPLLPVVV